MWPNVPAGQTSGTLSKRVSDGSHPMVVGNQPCTHSWKQDWLEKRLKQTRENLGERVVGK